MCTVRVISVMHMQCNNIYIVAIFITICIRLKNFQTCTFAMLRRTAIIQKPEVYTPKNIPIGLYPAQRYFAK